MNLTLYQKTKLDQLIQLLKKWNQAYNLTAITEASAIYTHHILDSLSIAPFVEGARILDVGTGAGFPGMPLALYFPEKHFVLLDSNGKKTRFLTQAVGELKLQNVEIVQSRIEAFQPKERFDHITTRATLPTEVVLKATHAFLKPTGTWLLMKGQDPSPELQHLQQPARVERLSVPGLSERHLLIVRPSISPV